MKWFIWRIQVSLDLMERYGIGIGAAWRAASDCRPLFDLDEPSSAVVWND